ncbi:MAG: hypothetical protein ACIAQZ_11515 [Sedimentisphaeraceae bacterium JB056]
MLIYRDWQSMPRSLNIANGRLGFLASVSVGEKEQTTLVIAPAFQKKGVIPDIYTRKIEENIDSGRIILDSLTYSTVINEGNFLILCPEILPLDDMTFSKYTFKSEQETKFRIYAILCRNIRVK